MTERRGTAVTGARRRKRHRLTAAPGQTFGNWTVVRQVPNDPVSSKARVLVRCACGIERVLRLAHLLSGDSKGCGWRHLGDTRIGALRVLRPAAHDSGKPAWLCACDCGREIVVLTGRLTHSNGPTTHCGCRMLKPAADDSAALPEPTVTTGLRVRARKLGVYQELRRRPGDVFDLSRASHFSPTWMERVPPTTPEKVTTSPDALTAACDALRPFSVTRRPRPAEETGGRAEIEFDPYANPFE
jgi:hypothetical protein